MRPLVLGALFSLMAALPASSGDVPFAEPYPPQTEDTARLAMPSLGEIMSLIQLRHLKLWYAGKTGAWDLADYQVGQIQSDLNRAALLYVNIPVPYIKAINQPLADMRQGAKNRDAEKFTRAYTTLTAACNGCHAAGNVGFIRIQTPTSAPFTNEDYGSQP
ncbi:hypothetical protein LMIY3S_01862 [Labrys miyagiensis]